MKKKILTIILLLALTSILWLPAVVLAITDNFDKFDYYIKALEYGLKGLIEYFNFIKDMFTIVLTT